MSDAEITTVPVQPIIETITENLEENAAPEENLEAAPVEEAPVEVETKTEEAKPPQSEEDKKFAAKFAALSKREKAVKAREKEFESKNKQLEERIKQLETQNVKPAEPEETLQSFKRKILTDPFKTLQSIGLDYETQTRMALNDGKPTPELQMQLMKEEILEAANSQIAELKKKLTDREEQDVKRKQETEEQDHARLIKGFKSQISEFVDGQKDNFELIALEGDLGPELVYDLIAKDAAEKREAKEAEGEELGNEDLMTIEEACKQVEESLLNEAKKRIEAKKIKELLGASQKSQLTPTQKAPVKNAPVTLSNSKSQAQGAKRAFLSDDESKVEAAKLIRWSAD